MTMRTYAGYLLMEDIYDYIPTSVPDITNLATAVFTPNLLVVENDCHTTLGKVEELNFESEGLVALDTGDKLTRDRITTLLSQGQYTIALRHTSACISKGGICKTCYSATFPRTTVPKPMDRVTLHPEFLVNSELVEVKAYTPSYQTTTNPVIYTNSYVYQDGVLKTPGTDYTIDSIGVLTLTPTPEAPSWVNVRFTTTSRSPYLAWMAKTYSGAMLGMKALPSQVLPVRTLLLSSELLENRLQLVSDYVKGLEQIPKTYTDYLDVIRDPLEKALYILAIFSLYYNVST